MSICTRYTRYLWYTIWSRYTRYTRFTRRRCAMHWTQQMLQMFKKQEIITNICFYSEWLSSWVVENILQPSWRVMLLWDNSIVVLNCYTHLHILRCITHVIAMFLNKCSSCNMFWNMAAHSRLYIIRHWVPFSCVVNLVTLVNDTSHEQQQQHCHSLARAIPELDPPLD